MRRNGKTEQGVKELQEEYTMEKLEEQIGYCFQDKHLLQQALTHTSYTNERKIN